MTEKPQTSQAVRAGANLALTACLVLIVLDGLAPRPWVTVAVIALSIVGIGARIETAIRESHETQTTSASSESIE